jgi:hypothetical protein
MMLNREDFARAADQEFDVFVGETTVTMSLVSIEPLRTQQGMAREAFSLIFKSANPVVLPQRIYAMRNRSLENAQKVDVFIVPIGRDPDGIRYQAVFN